MAMTWLSVTNPRRSVVECIEASPTGDYKFGNVFEHSDSPLGVAQYVGDGIESSCISHGPDRSQWVRSRLDRAENRQGAQNPRCRRLRARDSQSMRVRKDR